jgi:integrase
MSKKSVPPKLPESLRELYDRAHAQSTKSAYLSDMVIFFDWLEKQGDQHEMPLSPETVIGFLLLRSEIDALSTLKRRLSALSWAHRSGGFIGEDNPCLSPIVREAVKLFARKYTEEKRTDIDEAAPLSLEQIREMVMLCKSDKNLVRGVRDRAIFLLGFSGGFRRSEIVALDWEDVQEVIEGLEITVRRSKTDQEGRGEVVRCHRGRVPVTCPLLALKEWQTIGKTNSGKIFRRLSKSGKLLAPLHYSGDAINEFVRFRVREMGVKNWRDFSAHSLRKGFATTAIDGGASIRAVKEQGRWKSEKTLMRYVKNRNSWESAASAKLGL